MKKIAVVNNFTESVSCLQDGRVIICMKTDQYYEAFLTKLNQFVRTLEDGVEKIDESQPDVNCQFGFDADKPTRSITFTGDLPQVLDFCITYKLLRVAEKASILEALNPSKKPTKMNKLLQWLLSKPTDNSPDEGGSKPSLKNE